jgi:acyl dehydratase
MREIALQDLAQHTAERLGESPWKTVSQEMINTFAEATGDHQWIHVDVARATRESPWKSPVAQGFLTISLLPQLNQQILRVTGTAATVNYGLNKLRLPAAVKSGARIRSVLTLKEVNPTDQGTVLAVFNTVIEIEGENKPACVAENIAMYVPG